MKADRMLETLIFYTSFYKKIVSCTRVILNMRIATEVARMLVKIGDWFVHFEVKDSLTRM